MSQFTLPMDLDRSEAASHELAALSDDALVYLTSISLLALDDAADGELGTSALVPYLINETGELPAGCNEHDEAATSQLEGALGALQSITQWIPEQAPPHPRPGSRSYPVDILDIARELLNDAG